MRFRFRNAIMFFMPEGDEPGAGGGSGGSEPSDPADRMDRAAAMLRGDDEPAAGNEPGAGAGNAPSNEGEKPEKQDEKDGKPAEGDDDGNPDEKLAYFNEPRFQEIYKEWQAGAELRTQTAELNKIFTEGPYTIDGAETLKGVLADAWMLYDISNGAKHPGELLDVMKANWKPEQYKAVLQGLADYCLKNGVKPDEKAANSEPWRKELDELKAKEATREKEAKARADQEKQAKLEKEQMETVVEPTMKKVEELCIAQGFDPKNEDDKAQIAEYTEVISAAIGRDKNATKILEQIAKGKWGEVERLFTEHHNKLVKRAQRYGNLKLTAKQEKDKKIPKAPAGGTPPADAGAQAPKRDLKTSEGRVAAATKLWKAGAN